MSSPTWKLPTDHLGNVLKFSDPYWNHVIHAWDQCIMIDPYEFVDLLSFHEFHWMRSGCYATLISVNNGTTYPINLHELAPLLREHNLPILGKWGFFKKGPAVSLKYLGKESNK